MRTATMAVVLTLATWALAQGWTATTWQGEKAWTSTCGVWTATVSQERSRLIFLGETGGENLLYVPEQKKQWWWGGHVVWLGPQSAWNWPPPADWNTSAAQFAYSRGDTLCVVQPWTNAKYPPTERQYWWHDGRLACETRWYNSTTPFYAMQIIEMRADTVVTASLAPTDAMPNGFAQIVNNAPKTAFPMPDLGVKAGDTTASFALRPTEAVKLGFVPQGLVGTWKGYTLTMFPGPAHGTIGEQPDLGLTTQLWIGTPAQPFIELEQYSPYLTAGPDGVASFTVWLQPAAR